MWHFARADIPADLTAQKPNPSTWGTPAGFWSAQSCDISANFFDHQMVIDTTICGNWAGGSAYSQSGCPGTCADMVANATNYVGKSLRALFPFGCSGIRYRCYVGHQLCGRLPMNECSLQSHHSYCIASIPTPCIHVIFRNWHFSFLLIIPFIDHIPIALVFSPSLVCCALQGIGDITIGLVQIYICRLRSHGIISMF